jgi:hypothetical protein
MSSQAPARELLKKLDLFEYFTFANGRIECILNGHSIPENNLGTLERFVGYDADVLRFGSLRIATARPVFLRPTADHGLGCSEEKNFRNWSQFAEKHNSCRSSSLSLFHPSEWRARLLRVLLRAFTASVQGERNT